MTEPLMTWNLFLTLFLVPVCMAALGMCINRWIKQSDARRDRKEADNIAYREKKEAEIAKLLAAKEEQKEKEILSWRKTYTDNQCAIKNAVTEIGEKIHQIDKDKVDWGAWRDKEIECKEAHRRINDRFMGEANGQNNS